MPPLNFFLPKALEGINLLGLFTFISDFPKLFSCQLLIVPPWLYYFWHQQWNNYNRNQLQQAYFEFNMQPEEAGVMPVEPEHKEADQQRIFHLNKLFRIVKKYNNRIFIGNFKSYFYHLLKRTVQQRDVGYQPKQEVNWPFRDLLFKRYKTEDEILELQFVHMCAEKIQSVFRGFIAWKRHRKAFMRMKRFALLLQAAVRGWKVRNVMRCHKIKEKKRSILMIQSEVAKEQTSKGNTRKLEHLKNSLRTEINYFKKNYRELYDDGVWIYEPSQPKANRFKVMKWGSKKKEEPIKEINQSEIINTDIDSKPQVEQQMTSKPKRVRQMRDNIKRGRNKQKAKTMVAEEVDNAGQPAETIQNYSKVTYSTNVSDDRPIQAKGAYNFNNQTMLSNQQNMANQQNKEQNNDSDKPNDAKGQVKKIQKKKLQKRQKYDPRKAIQQQKKKRKQQMEAKVRQTQIKSQTSIMPTAKSQEEIKRTSQDIDSKSKRKTKVQKQENNRGTVNIPKNKAKAEPRIDCWGSRKTVVKKNTEEIMKTKINEGLIKAPSIDKLVKGKTIQIVKTYEQEAPKAQAYMNTDQFSPKRNADITPSQKLAAKIQERRERQKQRYQYSEEREKVRVQLEKKRQQNERIRQFFERRKEEQAYRKNQQVKEWKAQALRERHSKVQQRVREAHRPIEGLLNVYNAQYKNRYLNLQPKIQLLAAARRSQQKFQIPILHSESNHSFSLLNKNKLQQRFNVTIEMHEKQFKRFINS